MIICSVIGSVVATAKDPELVGKKLLMVERTSDSGADGHDPFIAVDTVGAGFGELVLVVLGSGSRETATTADQPIDAIIVGIIDSVERDGQFIYQKND